MLNYCQVCHAPKHPSELDKNGRCRNCIDAKAATDMGTTYGKYMAMKKEDRARWNAAAERLEEIVMDAPEKDRDSLYKIRTCPMCGVEFEYIRESKVYCSAVCRAAAQREREAGAEGQAQGLCAVCGKKLKDGRIKYCSDWCKYKAADLRRSGGA